MTPSWSCMLCNAVRTIAFAEFLREHDLKAKYGPLHWQFAYSAHEAAQQSELFALCCCNCASVCLWIQLVSMAA